MLRKVNLLYYQFDKNLLFLLPLGWKISGGGKEDVRGLNKQGGWPHPQETGLR